MFLTVPHVLGRDDSPLGNPRRHVAVLRAEVEGTLSSYSRDRDRLKGWLFTPSDGTNPILIVGPENKPRTIPATYSAVFRGSIQDGRAASIDVSSGEWLRHPLLGSARDHADVLASWSSAFSYAQENASRGVIGLRPRRSVPSMLSMRTGRCRTLPARS